MYYEVVCDYGDQGRAVVRYTRDAAEAQRIARQYEKHDRRVTRCYVREQQERKAYLTDDNIL